MTTYTTEIDIGSAGEQRVYGILGGDCYFNLHRIAMVYGSTIDPPTMASTVYYGDSPTYAQTSNCGLNYGGYLSIMFSLDNDFDNPIAVAELHKCAKGKSYLFVESYGIEKPDTAISLWFNQKKSGENWLYLNSTPTSVVMPYASDTFKFSEKKTSDVIEITGCRKCNNGKCLVCDLGSKFKVDDEYYGVMYASNLVVKNYGINKYGNYTYEFPSLNIEYSLDCDTIYTYTYYTKECNCTAYYKDDYDNWIDIYDEPSTKPVMVSNQFSYLDNCATSSISFTGCKTATIPLPIVSGQWLNYYPTTFVAYPTTSPTNKCFPTTYSDFAWDLNYNASPSSPIIKYGKEVSYEFPIHNLGTINYGVYIKTANIFIKKTPKYLEAKNTSCINITTGYPYPRSSFSLEYNGYIVCGGPYGIFCIEGDESGNIIDIWQPDTTHYPDTYGLTWYGYGGGLQVINNKVYNLPSYVDMYYGYYDETLTTFTEIGYTTSKIGSINFNGTYISQSTSLRGTSPDLLFYYPQTHLNYTGILYNGLWAIDYKSGIGTSYVYRNDIISTGWIQSPRPQLVYIDNGLSSILCTGDVYQSSGSATWLDYSLNNVIVVGTDIYFTYNFSGGGESIVYKLDSTFNITIIGASNMYMGVLNSPCKKVCYYNGYFYGILENYPSSTQYGLARSTDMCNWSIIDSSTHWISGRTTLLVYKGKLWILSHYNGNYQIEYKIISI